MPGNTWKNFAFLIKTSPFLHVALFSFHLHCSEKARDQISEIHEVILVAQSHQPKVEEQRERKHLDSDVNKSHCES